MFHGKLNRWPGLDLIIIDCQENLPVPGVSSPPTVIPSWNADEGYDALQNAFVFAEKHLQDNGAFIIIHSYSTDSKANIAGLCDTYSMIVRKEWMGMNRLHLSSAFDPSSTVC